MKKVLGFMVMLLSVVFLAACSSQENLDGEWYRYYTASNTGELSMDSEKYGPDVIISDSIIKLDGEDFTIDKEKRIIQTRFKEYTYTYENGVLTFDGKTYVKKGTKQYDEKRKEIENE